MGTQRCFPVLQELVGEPGTSGLEAVLHGAQLDLFADYTGRKARLGGGVLHSPVSWVRADHGLRFPQYSFINAKVTSAMTDDRY